MTSAAVLFYGRRSRSSSRTFDDLTLSSPPPFPSSSSSSSSSDPNTITTNTRHHNRNRRGDLHRRHRHISFDDPDHLRLPSPRPPFLGSEAHRNGNTECPSQEVNNRETVNGGSGRYFRNNRLPGAVLLARERLVQRLRGVSVSGNRENRETSPSQPSYNSWVVDADWETNVLGEESISNPLFTELPGGAPPQSSSREPQKPVGLTREAFSRLHHEVFVVDQNPITCPKSNESNDCSICLESFMEGNKLVNLPCGHRFHSCCLFPWLQTCGECPYCRSCIKLT